MQAGKRLTLPMPKNVFKDLDSNQSGILDRIKNRISFLRSNTTDASDRSDGSNTDTPTAAATIVTNGLRKNATKFNAVVVSPVVSYIHIDLKFPLFNPSRNSRVVLPQQDDSQLTTMDMLKKYELPPNQTRPPVTLVLNDTRSEMSQYLLNKWKREMIAKLGKEGFKIYTEETFKRGRDLHLNVSRALKQGTLGMSVAPEDQIAQNLWQSIHPLIEKISNVVMIEEMVEHPYIPYTGRVDCLASYDGRLAIIDFKTADREKPLYDYPLQLSAYAGAINFDNRVQLSTNVDTAIVIVAYTDGSPATLYQFDALEHWSQWLERLDQYFSMKFYSRNKTNSNFGKFKGSSFKTNTKKNSSNNTKPYSKPC